MGFSWVLPGSLASNMCSLFLNSWSFYFLISCSYSAWTAAQSGDEGARTPGLRLAKAALSQLSYIPSASWWA